MTVQLCMPGLQPFPKYFGIYMLSALDNFDPVYSYLQDDAISTGHAAARCGEDGLRGSLGR